MAIIIHTGNPDALLADIKLKINKEEIDTWEIDGDGDFTHLGEQVYKKAWLRPTSNQGNLTFEIMGKEGEEMTDFVYGYYHGHLVQMIITHFKGCIVTAS